MSATTTSSPRDSAFSAADAPACASPQPRWAARVASEYGSRHGWWRCRLAQAGACCGAYRTLGRVEWARVRRLVFVCKGNICRSPYAEACARRWGLPATSFGVQAGAATAHPLAIEIAAQRGIDLSAHVPRHQREYVAFPGDLVVAMEPGHLRVPGVRGAGQPAALLGMWMQPRRPFLQDPYGLSPAYFARCFALIDEAVARLAAEMRTAGHVPTC